MIRAIPPVGVANRYKNSKAINFKNSTTTTTPVVAKFVIITTTNNKNSLSNLRHDYDPMKNEYYRDLINEGYDPYEASKRAERFMTCYNENR